MLERNIKSVIIAAAVSAAIFTGSVQATTFDLYNDINYGAGFADGAELADALLTPGSGVNIIGGSSQFQGNFDNFLGGGGDGGEFPDGGDGDFPVGAAAVGDYGSASFFHDLNLGSAGGTDFVLPDGILLTSGNAAPPTTNTQSGFTGQASGLGDAGLDALLETLPGGHISRDATVLAFDFTLANPEHNAIALDFIFGTDEYSEYIDSYPEIAAVFIDGTNYASFNDGQLLTLTGTTVGGGNFFNNDVHNNNDDTYTPLDIEYDGVTGPLSLSGLLDPTLDVHSLKIAVSDSNDTILDTGLFVANLRGLTIDGSDPDEPQLPVEPGDPEYVEDTFTFVIEVGDAGVGIDPTTPFFIDPYVATGYTYETTGANFATVEIPDTGTIYNSDTGLLNVYAWDGTDYVFQQAIGLDEIFTFAAGGVSKFKIDGIDVDAALDPADGGAFNTGVTFTGAGSFTVTQTPIETCDGEPDCANIPEPGSLLLLAGGLLGFRLSRRTSK